MYSLEQCQICKGGHSTKKHHMAVKMANSNFKSDRHNWEERHKRLNEAVKK